MPPWFVMALLLRWASYVLFALAVASFVVSGFYFRRAQQAPYYILREKARQRGLIWLIATAILLVIGLAALLTPALLRPPEPENTPLPSPTALSTLALPTATWTLAPPTATPEASATAPFIPTSTPTSLPTATTPALSEEYPLPEGAAAQLPGAVPAPPEARIAFVAFATEEQNERPVDPGFEFPTGDWRVYFFFDYDSMARQTTWTYAWYGPAGYLDGNTCLWGADVDGCPRVSGVEGNSYLYFRAPGGYQAGVYEVRVWIEERIQVAAQFTIVP